MLDMINEQLINTLDIIIENIGTLGGIMITLGILVGVFAKYTPTKSDDQVSDKLIRLGNETKQAELELRSARNNIKKYSDRE